MKIDQLRVTKSTLFGDDLVIDFSKKMTCIMGGRGTGKTTLLTFIKWCIAYDSNFSKTELNLIKSNLGAGTVELKVTGGDGKPYVFIKNWGDDPHVKDANGDSVSMQQIFTGKIVDFYSSGSIEQIGMDPTQRMRIVDNSIGIKLDEINREISITKAEIDKNQSELLQTREDYKRMGQEISLLVGVENQLKEAQEALAKQTSNSEEKELFDKGIEKQKKRQLEAANLLAIDSAIMSAKADINSFEKSVLDRIKSLNEINLDSGNINSVRGNVLQALEKILSQCAENLTSFQNIKEELEEVSSVVTSEHKKQELEFAEIRKKLETNRELYQKVTQLNESVTKLSLLKKDQSIVEEKGKALNLSRNSLLDKYFSLHEKRTAERQGEAERLNGILGKDIKVLVKPNGNSAPFEAYIREILPLGKMKVSNEHLLWELSSPAELLKAINEKNISDLADQLNLPTERLESIVKTILIHDKKADLETLVCDDQVNFFLKVDSSDHPSSYRPTEHLSLGQRCTTILPILFSISNVPLIIDQPEDNLDNRFIADTIHHIIKNAKEVRQLTFVTHNPNIPVVADSEHNVFMSYIDGESKVDMSGTVDRVKTRIIELLEGGEEAFKQRKKCYGY